MDRGKSTVEVTLAKLRTGFAGTWELREERWEINTKKWHVRNETLAEGRPLVMGGVPMRLIPPERALSPASSEDSESLVASIEARSESVRVIQPQARLLLIQYGASYIAGAVKPHIQHLGGEVQFVLKPNGVPGSQSVLEALGLRWGDVLVEVDAGQKPDGSDSIEFDAAWLPGVLFNVLEGLSPGNDVRVDIVRQGKKKTLQWLIQ